MVKLVYCLGLHNSEQVHFSAIFAKSKIVVIGSHYFMGTSMQATNTGSSSCVVVPSGLGKRQE
jgi:hypothetical protein